MFLAWWQGGEDPYRLFNQGRRFRNPDHDPDDPQSEMWLPAGTLPEPAQPIRRKWFMYGCAEVAFDMAKRLHGVHPDQHKKGSGNQVPEGYTEMRLPGGSMGMKRTYNRTS